MPKLFKSFDLVTLLKYGVAALLLVVPLYPKFPLFNVPGTYVAVRAEDFIILLLGVILFLYVSEDGWGKFFKSKLNQAIVLFWLAGLLSCLSAIFLTHTVSANITILHWARRIEYTLPFFAASAVVQKTGRGRFFIQNLFIAVFFVFLFGFGQIHFGFPVITTQNEEYSKGLALTWISGARLSSTFAGHYDLAAFLVIVLPICTTLFFYYKKLKNKLLFLTFSVLPGFWLMLKAESRVSFIAFLVGVCVSLWIFKKKMFIVPVLVLAVLGAVFFSNLGTRYRLGISTYWQRLINNTSFVQPAWAQEAIPSASTRTRSKELQNPMPPVSAVLEDRSTAIRLNIEWPRAIRAFAKNPLLGTGYSSITLATDNDYLRALGEVGAVGTLSFLLIILRIFERLIFYIKNAKHGWKYGYVVGFFGSFVGLLFNATFIDVFEASKVAIIFWALAGVAVGITKKHVATERGK